MASEQLKESLLWGGGSRDSVSLRFGDSSRSEVYAEYDSNDGQGDAKEGRPFFHRGVSLGTTSRTASVDRKTWDVFTSRSLGRSDSCEFSSIEQANLKVLDRSLVTRICSHHHKSTRDRQNQRNVPMHLSIFGLPVMSPFNTFAKWWLAFIATVDLTFTAFCVPYITAFLARGSDSEDVVLEIVDIATGCVFLLDVFIKFHIGFVVQCDYRTKVEMRGKHIAWYYFHHGGAWIDFVSVIPSILGVLVLLIGFLARGAPVHLIRYIRMIRIVRLVRALSSTSMLTSTETKIFQLLGPTTMYLLSVIYCLVVLVNFLGCLLYFVAVAEDGDLADTWIYKYSDTAAERSDAYHYLLGIYWAITTVTTVGYGDVTPETWIELLLMGIIMLTQIVIFGFLIGTMTEIVTNSMTQFRQAEKYKEKMESVQQWLMHYDIPEPLVASVKSFYSQVWLRKQDVDESHILNDLPYRIKSSIIFAMIGKTLESLPLFQFLDRRTISKISSRMTPMVKYPDDQISYDKQDKDAIFILEDGSVFLISDDSVATRYSAPDLFGAGAILSYFSEHKSVRTWRLHAYSCCRVWKVQVEDLFDVVDALDNGRVLLLKGFWHLLFQRMAAYNDEVATQKMLETELGRRLTWQEVSRIQTEILKDAFSVDNLVEAVAPPSCLKSQGVTCDIYDAQAIANFSSIGCSKERDMGNTFGLLFTALKDRGAHGAVGYIAALYNLCDKYVSTDTLSKSFVLFGVDSQSVESLDIHKMKDTERHGEIPISNVVSRLVSYRDWDLRATVVKPLFSRLFRKNEVSRQDVLGAYNCEDHPDVQAGLKSKAQVLNETLSLMFKTDTCTVNDFMLYHQTVSLCIDSENHFREFLHAVWNVR